MDENPDPKRPSKSNRLNMPWDDVENTNGTN